jgi:hypothetical protein
MEERGRLLKDYAISVQHPEVSGFEILELLDLRSQIAELEAELTEEEKKRLEEADSVFLRHASRFYESLSLVADLAEMRQQVRASPSHWWWHLEKLIQVEKVSSGGRP